MKSEYFIKVEKNEYPKFLYHKSKDAKLVKTEDEHKALGKDWAEAPFEAKEKQTKPLDKKE